MDILAQTAPSAANSTTSAAYRRDVHAIVQHERPDLYAYWQQVKPKQVKDGYLPDACTHTGTRTNGRLGVRWNRDTKQLDILPDGYAARLHERYQRTPGGLYAVTVPLHTVSRFDRGQDWTQAAQLVQEVGRELSPETEIECTAEVSPAWMLHGHYLTDITAAVKALQAGFSVEEVTALGLLDLGGYQVKPVQAVNCGHNSEGEGWRYAPPENAAQGVINVLSVQQEQGYLPRMRATLNRGKVSAPAPVSAVLHNLRPERVTTPPSQQQPATPTPSSEPIDHRHRHRLTALLSSERMVKVTRPNRATRRATRKRRSGKVKPDRRGSLHGDQQRRQQQAVNLHSTSDGVHDLEAHSSHLDPPPRKQDISSYTSSQRCAA